MSNKTCYYHNRILLKIWWLGKKIKNIYISFEILNSENKNFVKPTKKFLIQQITKCFVFIQILKIAFLKPKTNKISANVKSYKIKTININK